ncbi:MAG: diguanylate cyclase [Actinomycetota bacterium]|nr:diguanylate cyclase [Actinomycetota bacterium]
MVPNAVLEATRSLLWVDTAADAARIAATLVQGLGGDVVPADTADGSAIPADLSFGEGAPVLAAARPATSARTLLDRYLPTFLLDARQALELSDRVERLAESASTDVLTGLPNRRMLERSLGRLADSEAVIMLDLDHFKAVNDDFGHAVGDDVLRSFGAALLATVRGRDTVGRYGGEEFVVVLPASAHPDAFLSRLRDHWLAVRPQPITFSAGIALSSGDPAEVMARADAALYEAKEAGRDRWVWARAGTHTTTSTPGDFVESYLGDALSGDRTGGVRQTLDLLDNHVPYEQIVVDLLAAAQCEVGERWQRNELTPVDEHLASGVAAAALDALAAETSHVDVSGLTVVTCSEGDWHSLAAQMFGESLRSHGFGVSVLGASTPVDAVADFLDRSSCDALAVSCSLPIFFPGVIRLIDAAHARGIPAIVGGRAFGTDSRRALHLGADAWAASAQEAAPVIASWRSTRPTVNPAPIPLDPVAAQLFADADALGAEAMQGLARSFPAMAAYDEAKLARTREDLVYVVQFLAAALAARDDTVFFEFLGWLEHLLARRGVPPQALPAGLDALRPGIGRIDETASRLLDSGNARLAPAARPRSNDPNDRPAGT